MTHHWPRYGCPYPHNVPPSWDMRKHSCPGCGVLVPVWSPGNRPAPEAEASSDPVQANTARPGRYGGDRVADTLEVHWVNDIGTIMGLAVGGDSQTVLVFLDSQGGWRLVGPASLGVAAHHVWLKREGYTFGVWRTGDPLPELT